MMDAMEVVNKSLDTLVTQHFLMFVQKCVETD